jgi:hypothetical protein
MYRVKHSVTETGSFFLGQDEFNPAAPKRCGYLKDTTNTICCIEESGGEILNTVWISFICGVVMGGVGGIFLMCVFSLSSQTEPYDNE